MATPKLALIPTGYKAGKLYSVLPESGVGDFTVVRATEATRVNEEGLIETMGANVPRLDYSGGGCPVLLTEGQSTNLLPYSEDFSQSNWVKVNNAIVSATKVISPDGTLNASQIIFDGTSQGRIEDAIPSLIQGVDYTVSVYARVSSGTQIVNFGSVNDFSYTLTTEWQRLTSTEVENDTVGYPRLICNDAATIEIWGFQLEQQSYATSYIPTDGSSVTRNQDVCTNGGSLASINSTSGTLYFEGSALDWGASANNQISLSDGSGSNRIMIYPYSENQLGLRFNANASQLVSQTITVSILSVNFKIAIRWGNGNYSIYQNGLEAYTQSISSTPLGLSKLNFSSATGGSNFFGKTKAVAVWKEALSDQELAELTTI